MVPSVFSNATYGVKQELGIYYGQGILCDPQKCSPNDGSCQKPESGNTIDPLPGCNKPAVFNLTLDMYTPITPPGTGPRPAFVAIHSGGYAVNNESGFAPTFEMEAACKYFAARGFVAITMVYRLTNAQTGGGLRPVNWSEPSPLPKSWQGGFKPAPQTIYPAVRDTKAAIRWLRSMAPKLNLDSDYIGAAGWSAGACTTAFLASQYEWDFTTEMNSTTDPTFHTLEPFLSFSSSIKAGVVWAGNGVVTETKNGLDHVDRYATTKAPLAMYRGSQDTVMTPWAQTDEQGHFNSTGGKCDLFEVPGVGHGTLFPTGTVQTKNGAPIPGAPLPVLNHSYIWMTEAMGLNIIH